MKQDDRFHNTDNYRINFKNVPIHLQNPAIKPRGLWFSFGAQWIDWCNDEMPQWIKPYNYQLIIVGNILKITNEKEFIDFNNEFGIELKMIKMKMIDWSKVCSKYDGIEIANVNDNYNYFWKFRYDPEFNWYNSWDIGSGCVWTPKEIIFKKL